MQSRGPIRRGALYAVLAAIAFGLTTPIIERAGAHASSLAIAALLYLGATLSGVVLGVDLGLWAHHDAPLRRAHLGRLLLIGLVGAGVAPVAFAWGLFATGSATASLLLNFEAVFTVLLARLLFHEAIGRRVMVALLLMFSAGVVLALGALRGPALHLAGVAAVVLATAAWAMDNALSRPLADVRPLSVVAAKGAIGASLTTLLALVLGRSWPPLADGAVLVACGATGYGASLVLYLRAQRLMGAARTGSVFAVAPFVGALAALALGQSQPHASFFAAAPLFALGVWLHISEHHRHIHHHAPLVHEHAHTHDDGHHQHTHDPPVVGEHNHAHEHEAQDHEHEHSADLHHRHDHE